MRASIDDLLRGEGVFDPGAPDIPLRRLLLLLAVFGMAYGLVMGSYGGRPLQAVYSAAKVPLLLLVSVVLCLANFFMVNSLLGLRSDFGAALRAVLTAQAGVALSLAALAPVTAFFYASLPGGQSAYATAVAANGVAFMLSSFGGQLILNRAYESLALRDPRHRQARRAWLGIYVFVAIQMAWTLRPFIGDPDKPTRFFREGAWGNAYVEVARLLLQVGS